MLTYILANAGFNVTNTIADSAGFSDFLEQHAEALRIMQTIKAVKVNITQMLVTAYTAADNQLPLQHLPAFGHLVLTKFAFVWQEYRPLMDWKVVAAAPLVIENQLPINGTYLIWETPKVSFPIHKGCCLCSQAVFML